MDDVSFDFMDEIAPGSTVIYPSTESVRPEGWYRLLRISATDCRKTSKVRYINTLSLTCQKYLIMVANQSFAQVNDKKCYHSVKAGGTAQLLKSRET